MFTTDQRAALEAPLNRSNVKARKQGGRNVSYIEGWKAIEEANRIFGFDGWTRETVDIKCVSERERKIGGDRKDGWGVSYIARVKVVVFAGDQIVTREGIGSGHGIDVDCGQAHESAIKESETDAMKRALMTFGNPFGLALYDKTQANVADDRTYEDREKVIDDWGTKRAAELGNAVRGTNNVVWDEAGERPAVPEDFEANDFESTTGVLKAAYIDSVRDYVRKATDAKKLHEWWNSDECKKARRDFELTEREVRDLVEFCSARIATLKRGNGERPQVVGGTG
jgi:DNA repair and recombination protein RAD52